MLMKCSAYIASFQEEGKRLELIFQITIYLPT